MSALGLNRTGRAGGASAGGRRVTPNRVLAFGAIAFAIAAYAFPNLAGGYWINIATIVAVYATAAVGLDLITGYGGMLSLGHAAFFGVGAYTVAVLGEHTTIPGFVLLFAAVGIAGLVGVFVGALALRTEGHAFALVTLGFALILASLVNGLDFTGGPSGIAGISRDVFGSGELSDASMYLLTLVVALVGVGLLRGLRSSRTGRALLALKAHPELAAAVGVNVFALRLQAFVIGAAYAGLAGGLFAETLRYVSSDFIGLTQSVQFLMMVVIGGLGTGWGALVGAIIVRGVPEAVESLANWQLFAVGFLTLLIVARFRRGIAGTLEDALHRLLDPRRAPVALRPEVPHPEVALPPAEVAIELPAAAAAAAGSARSSRAAVLAVSGITRAFGGLRAVDGVDYEVRAGEIHSVVGPNGAGKSTFINLVTGIDHPDGGTIVCEGRQMERLPAHRRARLGMSRTFQLVELCEELTIRENVMLGAYHWTRAGFLRGAVPFAARGEERVVRNRADAVLARLGLSELADEHPSTVSVGQRRLVEVGRCLLSQSPLVFLDEPAAGLNEAETSALGDVLRELRDEGVAIVLVDHDMRLIMSISDRVTVLNFGRTLASGDPAEVVRQEEVIHAYLGTAA
ncbi:MAG TPA: branched-chain amino acid ABC transporter ATP-binding protein/permease [Conexibacter sp.]|jgi:branched-chain amino acid transport system permease protein